MNILRRTITLDPDADTDTGFRKAHSDSEWDAYDRGFRIASFIVGPIAVLIGFGLGMLAAMWMLT